MEANEGIKPVIEAFNLMWSKYPEPAMLIHKSKELVAVNQACREFGREAGTICAKHGAPEHHQDCLASKSLSSGKAMFLKRKLPDNIEMTVYWLPLAGHPDYYVHFSAGSLASN